MFICCWVKFEWLFGLAIGIFENEIGKGKKDVRGGYL
jgi:hypothetical protein